MATYKHLRSSTANKRPTTSIADGQLAINTNTASPGLFFKDSAGTGIVKVGPVHVGTTAPNSVPASGGSTGNYKGEQWLDTSVSPAQLKVWNGSAWVGVVADELPVSKLQDGDARQLLQTDAAGTGVEWTSNVDVPGTLDVTSTATFDSIARHPLGTAGAPTITFTGDTNTGIYSPGADQLALSTNGTGRLFVDASGNVGVGTTSPSASLHVASSAGTNSTFSTAGAGLNIDLTEATGTARLRSIGGQLNLYGSISGTGNGAITFWPSGAATERARIDSSGRLLQGTSSVIQAPDYAGTNRNPYQQLAGTSYESTLQTNSFFNAGVAVNGAGTYQFTRSNTNTIGGHAAVVNNSELGFLQWSGSDGTNYIRAAQIYAEVDGTPGTNAMPGRLVFSTTSDGASSPTQRMRIDSSGNVFIAQSTTQLPGAGNTTEGHSIRAAGNSFHSTASSYALSINRNTTDGIVQRINREGIQVGSISVTTTATAYNTSSDYRLKENVTPVTDGITRLQQLKPSRFNFIADPTKTVDGFIAHEVQNIVPEAITGEKDAVDDEGNPQYQGIDQSKIVPLVVAALQEAIAKIEALEQRLNDAGIN